MDWIGIHRRYARGAGWFQGGALVLAGALPFSALPNTAGGYVVRAVIVGAGFAFAHFVLGRMVRRAEDHL